MRRPTNSDYKGSNNVHGQVHDVETPIPSAQGYPVLESVPVPSQHPPPPQPAIYIIEQYPVPQDYPAIPQPDPRPGMMVCAILGFTLSWIPLVGLITLLCNLDAPRGSPRHFLASSACCISALVFLSCFLFWPWWM